MNPKDVNFEKAFAQASQTTKEKLKLTDEEQEKFKKAMKDPEFCRMLADYMEEISDPQHRAETDAYLAQLENENKVPTNKQLIIPTPGFVVKTYASNAENPKQKVFINVCASEKIDQPQATKVEATETRQAGSSWSLPHALGPQRFEKDSSGNNVMTYDVCFHPDTINFTRRMPQFRDMVMDTSVDGVERVMKNMNTPMKIDKKANRVLKGVQYKTGKPATMCISTPKEAPKEEEKQKPVATLKTVKEPKKASDTPKQLSEVSRKKVDNKPTTKMELKPTKKIPSAQIIQRGNFDMAEFLTEGEKAPFRPRELVVKIDIPDETSVAKMDLDVSEKSIKLLVPGFDLLELPLPYQIIEQRGKAKFDKKKKLLVVTLPVVPPPRPDPAQTQELENVVENDIEAEAETEEQVQNQVAAEPTTLSSTTTPVNASCQAPNHSRWVSSNKGEEKHQEKETMRCIREAARMAVEDYAVKAATSTMPKLPKYTFKQTTKCISILIAEPNVLPYSVKSSFDEQHLKISFEVRGEKELFVLDLELDGKIDPSKSEVDVASRNMVVILYKADNIEWTQLERRQCPDNPADEAIAKEETLEREEDVFVEPVSNQTNHDANASMEEETKSLKQEEVLTPEQDTTPVQAPITFQNELLYELD